MGNDLAKFDKAVVRPVVKSTVKEVDRGLARVEQAVRKDVLPELSQFKANHRLKMKCVSSIRRILKINLTMGIFLFELPD